MPGRSGRTDFMKNDFFGKIVDNCVSILAAFLALLLTGAVFLPVVGFAAGDEVTVSSTKVTKISLAQSYSDFKYNGSSKDEIYIEKSLCPEPYFDCVRIGDSISVNINGIVNKCAVESRPKIKYFCIQSVFAPFLRSGA